MNMVTNKNKVTLGGSWLLLVLLMIGMSWSAAISPVGENLQVSENDGAEIADDPLALPDEATNPADNNEFGYDPAAELIGARTQTAKTFLKEDGGFEAIVSPAPVHYLDNGAWEEIDLNLESTEEGWAVTENTFESYFYQNPMKGVEMVVDGQTIRYGIMPQVVVLDGQTLSPEPYMGKPSAEPIDVGGSVIRYPMMTGVTLDYQVSSTQLKQNLMLSEAPQLLDHQKESGFFGIAETMYLPVGYALFLGESPIADGELVRTNESLTIRNLETGELLVTIPQPMVDSIEPALEGPHIGDYVIRVQGEEVSLTTVVENSWLLDSDNRSYPLFIDPTMDKGAATGGYANYYRFSLWGWYTRTYERAYSYSFLSWTCRGTGSYLNGCTSSSSYTWFYRHAWYRFDLGGALPSGATVNSVDFKAQVGRFYSGNRAFDVAVLKSGSAQTSNQIDPSSYLYSNGYQLNRYIRNSPASSASTTVTDPGYYWSSTARVRSISMNSNGVSDVQDAVDGNAAGASGNVLGLAVRNTANAPFWYWCSTGYYTYYGCTSTSRYAHLHLDYTGGSDTTPPEDDFVAYTGLKTHRAEKRTFWLGLRDTTGVDTTAAGGPHLQYRVNNGSWTGVAATTIGTCAAANWCNFRAAIPAVAEGDYVQYFWAFQDLVGTAAGTTGNPNFKTLPVGGTGTPSSITAAPTSPYNYFVQPVEEADAFNSDGTNNNKWQVKIDGVNNYRYYSTYRYFDEQLTYYEDTEEWIWEYDTSNCGSGSYSCFNSNSVYELRYSPSVNTYSYSNCASSTTCKVVEPSGGLSMSGTNGPGMSTIWWYNSAAGAFTVVGLDDTTGIDQPVAGTSVGTNGGGRNCDDCSSAVPIPGDITMKFGTLSINGTFSASSTTRNWFCVNSNNHPLYFQSSSSSSPYCLSTYTFYRYDRQWNGWAAPGYDGRWSTGTDITQKVSTVRPQPDIYPPELDHTGLMDTHSEDDRKVTVGIMDAGDPPTGTNVSTGTDANGILEGPHMKYRVYNATTLSWSGWTTRAMSPPAGTARASCELASCDWSATIPGTERDNSVEYTLHVKDNNGNWNNTTATSYLIGTPTKVFTIEWHDQTCGFSASYSCSWQIKLYDVTNEVEFHYDTSSSAYYDYQSIGYQKGGATAIGATLKERGTGYVAGANPFANNFRISTSGNAHANEVIPVGMTELYNYDEVFTGTSNGRPYTYYCTRYWYNYKNQCAEVISLPTGFDFDYFGTTYSGNSSHTIHALRHGAASFSQSSSTVPMQMSTYYPWYGQWPTLPNTGSYVNNVHLAPWFGYYASYYCYNSGNSECSIRTKTIPFDGAGMDVYADITTPTTWDNEMSPIRIVPSGDYLRVTADLTIEPGVEIQIASGKGLDIAGACSKLTVSGNATHPTTITNLGTANAKGIAFTNGGCTTANTDERHTFDTVGFSNLDTAIAAGSRHGNAPHYNGNVGNFTLTDVTFENVGTAIKHGSGQGTGFDLSGVDITNATASCVDLPDNSVFTWREGSATNCNTGQSTLHGGILTGDGSSVTLENLTMSGAENIGIAGGAHSLWMSNVSMSTTNNVMTAATGISQELTGVTSGTDFYANNVNAGGYNAVTIHATDSVEMTTFSTGGSLTIEPGGGSAAGASGMTWSDLTIGGDMTVARVAPAAIENAGIGGSLIFGSTAASADQILITDLVVADQLNVRGCGYNVRADSATIGDSLAGTGLGARVYCTSNTARSSLTVVGSTIHTSSARDALSQARSGTLTIAESVLTSDHVSPQVGRAGRNGEVRIIGVTFAGNGCADAGGWVGATNCPMSITHSTGFIYVGGTAQVAAYRVMNLVPVFVADHAVTTTTVSTSGICPGAGCIVTTEVDVGTTYTDATGNATAWLIQSRLALSGTTLTTYETYTDHSIAISGGAGQNETTPADAWYSATCVVNGMDCSMPLSPGDQVYIKLEAMPQDWGGAAKDCAWLAGNTSTTNGYHLYTMQIITLSTNLVLDGCKMHLNGTKFTVNRSATNNPTITIQNGGELLLSEGGGEIGNIRAVTSTYGWEMDIQSGGKFVIDNGFIRDMYQNSNTNGAMNVGDGATLELKNGAIVYGSQTVSSSMATINVDGGTLLATGASVYNAQQSGVGISLQNTGASNLQNIAVSGADTGISIVDAAPSVDGFTLTDNRVGVVVDGGMTLPSIYRSTLLSGQSAGWNTYEIDLTGLAGNYNYIQFGFNNVYNGGNVHPLYNWYSSRYYAVYDRMRIAIDDNDGNGLENFTTDAAGKLMTGYYHSGDLSNLGNRLNPDHPSRNDGWARYDCNYYGYQYSPGGSYQYGYYYYLNNYGPYTQGNTNYYGANAYPSDFGFTMDIVDGLTGSQNYYPYNYWGYYWPSWYFGSGYQGGIYTPPEGFNGLWGYYNVCLSYAYRYQTPTPNGWRMSWPIVDVSSPNVNQVSAYMDILHNYADYYQDRYDFVFRGGNTINELMNAQWGREFGKASLANGVIDGSDTGIEIADNYAAADISTVVINSPADEGVLVAGTSATSMNGVTVNNGRYGIRTTAASGGALDALNVNLDNQSQDGIVLASALNLGLSGAITNASGSGVNVLSSSSRDWNFNGLSMTSNNLALNHDGSGELTCKNCVTGSNLADVATSGLVTWIEGDVDLNIVSATGSGMFQRGRLLDLTVTADLSGVANTGVTLVDGNNRRVANGETDGSGTLTGMVFFTNYIDASGLTVVNLAGYQVMTVAKVAYSSTVADFRYAIKGVTLVDAPGNSDSVALTDNFDARVCYSWTSSSYNLLQSCSGSNYLSSSGSRTKSDGNAGTITEYGYYGAMPTNMQNKAILIDSPYAYTGSSGASFNNSVMFWSGFYSNQWSDLYVRYPYSGTVYADNTQMTAIGTKGTEFFNLGYYGGYNYGNFEVSSSTLVNLGSVGSGAGYYNRDPVVKVTDSTLVSYSQIDEVQSVYPEEICVQSAGNDPGDFLVDNNTMYDCTVGVMIYYNYYATSTYYGGTGTDGYQWSNNTLYDSNYLPFWIYIRSYSDDGMIDNNTITGSKRVGYGIYAQDNTANSVEIRGNTILSADNPIYLRNAKSYNINNNSIHGNANSANAGIYVRNGEGTIADNVLSDADGGINVYGVRSGYDVAINGNTIGASGGRVSPTATGIYLENCGLAQVTMNGNSVSTTSNALVSDGCDVSDVGSNFASAGGSASQIHTVNIEASQYSPAVKNISTGDTVRWVLTQYNSDPNNYQHSTTSNSSLWDSGLLNLGATFTHTFTSAGSYEYHCTVHSWMSGVINVASGTGGTNLQTYGIDIIGGAEDISLDGTAIGGFSLGYRQDGGSLSVSGNSAVTGDNGFELTNVEVTVDGLSVSADSGTGVAIDASSNNGRHALDIANFDASGAVGLLADGHENLRWNGGTSSATTTLQTLGGAAGTIENMSWADTTTQINAGAYSIITSVGNVLNQSQLTIGTSAVVHEGNLLDLTVTHMGAAASDVGVMIKSTDNGRSEYVSPSWRSNIISVGEGANGAAAITDWFVSHPLGVRNIADDAMPGAVAVNPDPTSQAMGYMTWDNTNLYIMLTGVTFTLTDGMWYLDTQSGGSTVGDTWYVAHNLPFEADFMLWAEDLNNWGIRKVMPGGSWVDTTASCPGMQAAPGFGIPGVTQTFSGISEFAIPWSCIGSPTGRIKTLAIVQNENSGHVLGVYPPQLWNQTSGAAQTFGDFGTLQLTGDDLADGTMDDYLLIHRTFTATGATAPRYYNITAKVRDADNIYWDWGMYSTLSMDQNRAVTIDILRAKPVIADLVDIEYDEDTGAHTVSLTSKAQDYQQPSSQLSWAVTNDAINPSNASSPYTYDLTGQTMTITPNADDFGNHRLYLTVTDGHGLYSSQSLLVSIQNVNDAPEIHNPNHPAGTPVFAQTMDASGNAVYNVVDEPQRRNPVTGEEMTWDLITKNLGSQNGAGFVKDQANEQDGSKDNNSEQAPQTYSWSAATEPVDCTPFSVSVQSNTLVIDLNEANEAGGTCDIVLDLSDGASVNDQAQTVSVPFTVNPVNDQPRILPWNVSEGATISTSYLTANGDKVAGYITDTTATHDPWYWQVDEDTEDTDLLTIDLTNMMSDNDHTIEQLSWEVDNTQQSLDQCNYENYFDISIDNNAHTLTIDLIPDATTDADSSEWDMLQDADGDGVPDDGIHQMTPRSGTFCAINLWMNDTASAPPQYDYAQSATGSYDQGSSQETLYIRVHNIVELRPDFNFNEVRVHPSPFDFKGIDGVLRETMVPVSVELEMEGDEPINPDGTYKYLYDLQVSFYVAETAGGAGQWQSSVRLGSNGPGDGDLPLPDWGGSIEVENFVRLNKTSEDVRVFVDVMTVNPFTGQYTDNSKYEKPALEEKNWADNNMTSGQTNSELPLIVETRAAHSVASFAPTLMAVGLVGVFVGALLGRARAAEDEEEFAEENMVDDEGAVSPVIATILLVAITVVLAGVIYVWAGSLADTSTKGVPRLTFTAEPITVQHTSGLPQDQWHWRITTSYAATDLATQAVTVSVLWNNNSGQQVYKTSLAPTGGDVERVYGFAPRNTESMVAFWDDISHCERGGAPCITEFGAGDVIFVRMTDNDGLIETAQIVIQYELPGGASYILKEYTASSTSIR